MNEETSRQVGQRITAESIPDTDQARRIWAPLLADRQTSPEPTCPHAETAPDGHRGSFAICVPPELTYDGGAGGDTREHSGT